MVNYNSELNEIIPPNNVNNFTLTNHQLIMGATIPPLEKLKMFSDKQFEDCVKEWAVSYLPEKYNKVYRCGGAGDMGRDIIGYYNYGSIDDELIWDNYQCKHYQKALNPSDIWLEIGKLCYFTYLNRFSIPRKYYFVCPNGVQRSLHDLLNDKNKFKEEFLNKWDTTCKDKITSQKKILLDEKLRSHINKIDFGIFTYLDPNELIEQHMQTPYFSFRFGGGLHKPRPKPLTPPSQVQNEELVYTKKLFQAYESNLKTSIKSEVDLKRLNLHNGHFQRQRIHFYQAESLFRFERDTIPPNINAFEDLKDELYYGVIDTYENHYPDGFERVKAVTDKARSLNLPGSNPLSPVLTTNDQHGICHHIVNDGRIGWVSDND